MPESLSRAQELTGKTLQFYEADLCDKDSLRAVMKKVEEHLEVKAITNRININSLPLSAPG